MAGASGCELDSKGLSKELREVVFSSPVFLYVFFPLVTLGYFLSPGWVRNGVLLAASLLFYAWGEAAYALLLALSALVNYAAGLLIASRPTSSASRRIALAAGVGLNVLALAYFKYWGFLASSLYALLDLDAAPPDTRLPLGISFFTFQAISYLVDIHRGEAQAQRNPVTVALYIALFPQLIAGPIVRYRSIADALRQRSSSLAGVVSGVELFVKGLAKKLLLANPLGLLADAVFVSSPQDLPWGVAWLGVVAYALQIYFDFSGYTDMARGLGRIFGFEFPENFRHPYKAASLREFWRRWHITLSSWLRDYVYIPLGGSRRGRLRSGVNLWLVFLLCGLWHGAAWNFVAWGALHGAWLSLERSRMGLPLARLSRPLRWMATALFLLFSWVLFRADSLTAAVAYWAAMLAPASLWGAAPVEVAAAMDGRFWLALVAAAFFALDGWEAVKRRLEPGRSLGMAFETIRFAVRYCVVMSGLLLSLLQLAAENFNPFIYFRF